MQEAAPFYLHWSMGSLSLHPFSPLTNPARLATTFQEWNQVP